MHRGMMDNLLKGEAAFVEFDYLPMLWGIQPNDFLPQQLPDIEGRHRKAMLLLHPSNHTQAPEKARGAVSTLCEVMMDAMERTTDYFGPLPPTPPSGTSLALPADLGQGHAVSVRQRLSEHQLSAAPQTPPTPPPPPEDF